MPENPRVSLVGYLPAEKRKGRLFVIGDVHGEYGALLSALHAADFDFEKDQALLAGDIHDRGRESEKCLNLLEEPWAHSTLGNHEYMLLNTLDETGAIIGLEYNALYQWISNGGDWAFNSKLEDRARWRQRLLDSVPLYWIVERKDKKRVLVCHAEPEPAYLADVLALKNRPIPLQSLHGSRTIWGRDIIYTAMRDESPLHHEYQAPVPAAEVLFSVHGHTQVRTPTWVGNLLFADTGAVFGNALTLVDIDLAVPGQPNGIYSWDISSKKLLVDAAVALGTTRNG